MGTSLEQPRSTLAPIIKHTSIGQTLVGMIVNAEQRDQQRRQPDGTWVTVLKPNGRPRREEILTYLVLDGTAQVGVPNSDDTRTIEPGELVRYIYKGLKWSQRIDAYNELAKGGDSSGMQVGDHHTLTVAGAVAVNEAGVIAGSECKTDQDVLTQRMKGRNITWNITLEVRRAKDDESDLVEEAEAHHAALKPRREPVSVEPQWQHDEEPF